MSSTIKMDAVPPTENSEELQGPTASDRNTDLSLPRRLKRSANACQRCRRRKQKCDLIYPRCSNCAKADVPCLSFHTGKQLEIPRSYVTHLENQVTELTKEVQDLRNRQSRPAATESVSPDSNFAYSNSQAGESRDASADVEDRATDLVAAMGLVALEGSSEPRFMGTSSGITFAKMVMAAVQYVSPTNAMTRRVSPKAPQDTFQHDLQARASSLPPRNAADYLVEIYFEYRTPHLQFLHRPTIQRTVEYVYTTTMSSPVYDFKRMERSVFTVHMVCAIALCGVSTDKTRPHKSEGCFSAALQHLDAVFSYSKSDLETLTAVLLLAQYATLCPSMGSVWQLTGIALRLCIDMGLHWETEAVTRMDPNTLNTRRQLFWTMYQFDRLMCISLGRPFGIVDGSINVKFPLTVPDDLLEQGLFDSSEQCPRKVAEHHVIVMEQLLSEIKHVLYQQHKGPKLAYGRPDYRPWLPDICDRLEEWHRNIPDTGKNYPNSIYSSTAWWDSKYSNALLLLYRPSPAIPSPSPESLSLCYDASCRHIASIKILYKEKNLHMVWIWVYRLFLAGLTMMYCLWHSHVVRGRVSLEELMSTTQSCSSVLAALAERFSGAEGCRDTFESLSEVTMKWFMRKDIPGEKPSYDNSFPLSDQNQQFAATDNSYDFAAPFDGNYFMTDPLDLGESLNSAAQWADYSTIDQDYQMVGGGGEFGFESFFGS